MAVCAYSAEGLARAARCDAHRFIPLPDLGGGAEPSTINNAGYAAGVSSVREGGYDTMIVWTPDDRPLAYGPGRLYRLNDDGKFAGFAHLASGQIMAVGGDLQAGPVPLPLPSGFVHAFAHDINAA